MQLKVQTGEEESKRKQGDEKLFHMTQQKNIIDQKLASIELTLRRKNEDILLQEQIIESLQKKLDHTEKILQEKQNQKGFFGIFGGGAHQTEQLQQKLMNYEEEIDIKTSEIERVHALVFECRKQTQCIEEELAKQKEINEDLTARLKMELNLTIQLQQDLQDQLSIMNNQEDQINIGKDKIQQLTQINNDLQATLQGKQEDQRRSHQEIFLLKDQTNRLKEAMFNLIPRLESELNDQSILHQLKIQMDQIFGVDKQKDQKIQQITIEKQLLKELLVNKDPIKVFEKAKERILKLGRNIEALERKNKVLTDKVTLYETKRNYAKSEILSDRTSVI